MERRAAELAAAGRAPACVILEPVLTGGRVVAPPPGYVKAVREVTRRHGVVLIFNEVTAQGAAGHPASGGLTTAAGGGTERFGVRPDIVALAKALGGGLPSGAIGMTPELADLVETGRVQQVGTYTRQSARRGGRSREPRRGAHARSL